MLDIKEYRPALKVFKSDPFRLPGCEQFEINF